MYGITGEGGYLLMMDIVKLTRKVPIQSVNRYMSIGGGDGEKEKGKRRRMKGEGRKGGTSEIIIRWTRKRVVMVRVC